MFNDGLVIFFTGLSGAGKTTLAKALKQRMETAHGKYSTLLDGDIIRNLISSELGFSRKDRDINILRIGYIASEIAKHGGIAICAAIAPYDSIRREVKALWPDCFILIHISTSLEVCEQRDVKGLYKQARDGKIQGFTGIDDPYEIPENANIVIDTTDRLISECVNDILKYIENGKNNA